MPHFAFRRRPATALFVAVRALALAVAGLVAASGPAAAQGTAADAPLGGLTAQSVRGEPLRAVVGLPGRDAPTVRIASPDTYARFGLARDPSIGRATLRTVVEADGKRFLRIDTDAVVDAPELVLLLEADGGTRLAYRVRFDSPEPADRVNVRGIEPIARSGAPVAANADGEPAVAFGTRSAAVDTRATRPAGPAVDGAQRADADTPPAMPIVPLARPEALDAAEGDTLETLARALRPPGATEAQSAFALWRANPRVFVG